MVGIARAPVCRGFFANHPWAPYLPGFPITPRQADTSPAPKGLAAIWRAGTGWSHRVALILVGAALILAFLAVLFVSPQAA